MWRPLNLLSLAFLQKHTNLDDDQNLEVLLDAGGTDNYSVERLVDLNSEAASTAVLAEDNQSSKNRAGLDIL